MREMLFIFDCDGVLVDSEVIASEVFSRAVSQLGLVMSPAEAEERFVGRSLADCLSTVETMLGRQLPRGFLLQLRTKTLEAFSAELQPVPGVDRILALLQARQHPRCVASNGDMNKMRHALHLTGLLGFFIQNAAQPPLFSADEVERGKPAPDLFLHAAQRMAFQPERCVVIEDSPAGVTAALAARMQVIAYVPRGARRAQDEVFRRSGVRVVTSMPELHDIILGELSQEL